MCTDHRSWTRGLRRLALLLALLVPAAEAADAGAAAPPAGEIEAVWGAAMAWGEVDGQALGRRLARGDAVYAGERLVTEARASLALRFSDGGRLQLGPDSEFTLARYRYADDGAAFVARIGKGVFRLVSGLIALRDRDAYRAELPTVTIGVRGTDFAGEIDGAAVRVMLLEPEGDARTAIEVWNAHGRVLIDTPGFGTEIADAGSAPSPPRRMQLQGLQNMMRTIQQSQRMMRPR